MRTWHYFLPIYKYGTKVIHTKRAFFYIYLPISRCRKISRLCFWSLVDVSETVNVDQRWIWNISVLIQRCSLPDNLWTALIQSSTDFSSEQPRFRENQKSELISSKTALIIFMLSESALKIVKSALIISGTWARKLFSSNYSKLVAESVEWSWNSKASPLRTKLFFFEKRLFRKDLIFFKIKKNAANLLWNTYKLILFLKKSLSIKIQDFFQKIGNIKKISKFAEEFFFRKKFIFNKVGKRNIPVVADRLAGILYRTNCTCIAHFRRLVLAQLEQNAFVGKWSWTFMKFLKWNVLLKAH